MTELITRQATSKFCFSLPIMFQATGGTRKYHHRGNSGEGRGKGRVGVREAPALQGFLLGTGHGSR